VVRKSSQLSTLTSYSCCLMSHYKDNTLYFGCRSAAKDAHYESEWASYAVKTSLYIAPHIVGTDQKVYHAHMYKIYCGRCCAHLAPS